MAGKIIIPDAVQNARLVPVDLTWPGGLDLTGKTLTGTKRMKYDAGGATAIDGTLTPDVDQSANPGVFTWDYGPGDVGTAGEFFVQLKATAGEFDATIEGRWIVHGLQSASAVAAEGVVGVLQSEADWLTAEKAATEAAADGNLLQSDGDNSEDSGIAAADVAALISAGGGAWGGITGTLSDQTDLQTELDAKESAGAAAAVQGNLNTHAALEVTAHGGVLPEAAGIVTVASSRDIATTDAGKLLAVTATATLNCPDAIGSNLQCAIASHGGTTTITAATTLRYLDGGVQTAASGVTVNTQCTLVHFGSNVWTVYGDVTPI